MSGNDMGNVDKDGITDFKDNCRCAANHDQIDEDNDSVGDSKDNCKLRSNSNQADFDDDGRGDVCDLDADGDGVVDRHQDEEPVEPTEDLIEPIR